MIFWKIRTEGDRNLGYLIGDLETGKAAVVDPSYTPDRFVEAASKPGLTITCVIGTHGHTDHTKGMARIKKKTGARSIRHKSSRGPSDIRAWDKCRVKVGDLNLLILHTPGHTPDSICILVNNKLITGDTLFVGKVGGTNSENMARKEYDSLHRLMKLGDDVEVFPGHNFGPTLSSTIGHERETNPFLLCKTFKDFLWLKNNWEDYKREYGIK